MKTLAQTMTSSILGIVVLCGTLGFLGACSNQDSAMSSSAGTGNLPAAAEISVAMDAPSQEDWKRLDAAIQKAEAYTDLSAYDKEVANLFSRVLEGAKACFDDPAVTARLVRGSAQQLESMMVVMDQETGAWMEKS